MLAGLLENEQELLRDLKRGDTAAFEQIFRYYHPMLLKLGQFYLEKHDAEEVVQDLFFGIWEKREKIEVKSTLKGYLLLSTKNRCLNHLKRNKSILSDDDADFAGASTDNADASIRAKQSQLLIHEALEKLPQQCRIIFLMHRQDHFTYKEIADLLEISPKTVENQIGKALKILNRELRELMPLLLALYMGHPRA